MLIFSTKNSIPFTPSEVVLTRKLIECYVNYDPKGGAFLRALNLNDYMLKWSTWMRDESDGVMGSWSPAKPFELNLVAPIESLGITYKPPMIDTRVLDHLVTVFPTLLHEFNHAFQFMPHKSFEQMMEEAGGTVLEGQRMTKTDKVLVCTLSIFRMVQWVFNRFFTLFLDHNKYTEKFTIEFDSRINTDQREPVNTFSEKLGGAIAGRSFLHRLALGSQSTPPCSEEEYKSQEQEQIRMYGDKIWNYAGILFGTVIELNKMAE